MILDKLSLEGKVAIVTGGGTGLGKAMCLAMARAGADIVAAARRVELIEQTAAEVRGLGRRALAIPTDVTDSRQVDRMVNRVLSEFERIDILVNNAGVIGGVPVTEMTEEQWDFLLAVNLKSQFLCCKYVLPHMIRQQSGKIINIGSVGGREGSAGATAYCAAKGGVHVFTHALAKEVAPYNINVNCVAPSTVNTPMLQGRAPTIAARVGIKEEEVYEYMCKRLHILGREILPEDVANAVLFLASEESRNIDGTVIYVDGGHLAVT